MPCRRTYEVGQLKKETNVSAKPLTKAETKWLADVEKLLLACPSKRIGAYTVGDDMLFVYDKEVCDSWLAENRLPRDGLDADALHRRAGSHLGRISTGFKIDSCAG
jgi:hypothetical protein